MDSLKDIEGHLHLRESQAILVQMFDDAKYLEILFLRGGR